MTLPERLTPDPPFAAGPPVGCSGAAVTVGFAVDPDGNVFAPRLFPSDAPPECGRFVMDDLNLKLSLDRARVVSDFLIARGVPKERLKVQGFGKEYPNDTNETPAGRGNNRRTELILPQ